MAPNNPRRNLPLRAGYRPGYEKYSSRITREFPQRPNPRQFHQTKDRFEQTRGLTLNGSLINEQKTLDILPRNCQNEDKYSVLSSYIREVLYYSWILPNY
ncbi:MAG: hypothetical protein KG012_16240, partial [Deltaproteobacteria bacterium]|nr:hypothetical protein [Deltaproteobacteria bacterium]